jgi:uncharacterized Zn-binding protein involved in type VI secretion
MPGIAVIGDKSTGHDGFPPTTMVTSPVSKTKFNGKKPGVVDEACQFIMHQKGNTIHPQDVRYPTKGSKKTKIEGYYVARIGDPLADGDVIAKGSDNSFLE